MDAIRNFLLVFDHAQDALIGQFDFGSDREGAVEEYSRLEYKYMDNRAIDVIFVGSDSIEKVKVTHGTYFEGRSRRLIEDALNPFPSQNDSAIANSKDAR